MGILKDLHLPRSFDGSDDNIVIARRQLIVDALRKTKAPVTFPGAKLLTVVERDGIRVTVIIVKVFAKLIQGDSATEFR